MKIDILTIFPKMFTGPFQESIVGRAIENHLAEIAIHDLRDWSTDKHRSVDDRPYGGGPGMVMRIDVIDRAISDLRGNSNDAKVILLSAKGERYTQQKGQRLSELKHLIFICGHYEEIDQRVYDHIADDVISIGDFVLTGGELPAMVIVDSVVRLLPGVVGDPESLVEESHTTPGFVEYPQYTRPEEYKGWKVPDILLSGNHAEIKKWQKQKAVV